MGRKAASGEQTAIVEDNVHQVRRLVARQRCQRAEIHEYRTITIHHDDFAVRPALRQPQPNRRCQSHGMLEIKEIIAMAQVIEFLRARPHIRHDQFVVQFRVDCLDTFCPLHGSILHQIPCE